MDEILNTLTTTDNPVRDLRAFPLEDVTQAALAHARASFTPKGVAVAELTAAHWGGMPAANVRASAWSMCSPRHPSLK
jgi:hypothetical protein